MYTKSTCLNFSLKKKKGKGSAHKKRRAKADKWKGYRCEVGYVYNSVGLVLDRGRCTRMKKRQSRPGVSSVHSRFSSSFSDSCCQDICLLHPGMALLLLNQLLSHLSISRKPAKPETPPKDSNTTDLSHTHTSPTPPAANQRPDNANTTSSIASASAEEDTSSPARHLDDLEFSASRDLALFLGATWDAHTKDDDKRRSQISSFPNFEYLLQKPDQSETHLPRRSTSTYRRFLGSLPRPRHVAPLSKAPPPEEEQHASGRVWQDIPQRASTAQSRRNRLSLYRPGSSLLKTVRSVPNFRSQKQHDK